MVTEPLSLTRKLILDHLVEGDPVPGSEIALRIDQTLTQDATGTMVMLELEAMGIERVATGLSVQYVDHNVLQTDFRNGDDHRFLLSACRRFGVWYSRAGNGVSHPVHMERFGVPGATLAGSDSHTPAAGALGMLAVGAGGLDVACAMAGEPLWLVMPKVLGVRLHGRLPEWVSAKDVVLEMLRRHGVDGCRGFAIEYHGPGLAALSAMDRHVIANMGTEMGATTSVFPVDQEIRRFLRAQGREDVWRALAADPGAAYDRVEDLDLSTLEPLIALPSSPDRVVTVRSVVGRAIDQAMIGSSANPGLRDFWIAGMIVAGRAVDPRVSFDINPTSRQVIANLAASPAFGHLIQAGARFHQAGCNGCIGMGQAPATGTVSLRTVPRNFPGRSGTVDDQVYLCSPETAAASALAGVITDPRDWAQRSAISYPRFVAPEREVADTANLVAPLPAGTARPELVRGPNIQPIPQFPALAQRLRVPILLRLGDGVSTDEILRAGSEALSLRSNIPAISRFAFSVVDPSFAVRATAAKTAYGGHVVVAGRTYAQGSSREHAALALRYLGQVAVLAKSYARIGWQNLVNHGIVPLEFAEGADHARLAAGAILIFDDLPAQLLAGSTVVARLEGGGALRLLHRMSARQVAIVIAGGVFNRMRRRRMADAVDPVVVDLQEGSHPEAHSLG
ncbi:MAG: aconitate hydratase [Planctomycetes bacterium]|nr:aconitate hydratase [Planctomycetota bacterium]